MNDIKTMVMSLLTQYRETQRYIEVLRYEMQHPPTISAEEIIDSLAFGHGDHSGPTTGQISDIATVSWIVTSTGRRNSF